MSKYYLGIDASKGYADFVLLSGDRKFIEKGFQLNDTFDGHCKLFEILSGYASHVIYAGIESTGGYENNWYHMLRKIRRNLNVHVARVNPYAVHHSGKANPVFPCRANHRRPDPFAEVLLQGPLGVRDIETPVGMGIADFQRTV